MTYKESIIIGLSSKAVIRSTQCLVPWECDKYCLQLLPNSEDFQLCLFVQVKRKIRITFNKDFHVGPTSKNTECNWNKLLTLHPEGATSDEHWAVLYCIAAVFKAPHGILEEKQWLCKPLQRQGDSGLSLFSAPPCQLFTKARTLTSIVHHPEGTVPCYETVDIRVSCRLCGQMDWIQVGH